VSVFDEGLSEAEQSRVTLEYT